MHLPSIPIRDRPTTATAINTTTNPPTDSSPHTSADAAASSSNPRFLNPLKFAKGERKGGGGDNKSGDSQQQGEMDLWYMTQPGENRYWMYLQDGLQMKLLQQRLQQTFNRKTKRPTTPLEPPAAAFPQPTNEAARARLNLLKWLSSAGCLLFYECEEVVSVDDQQLDEVLAVFPQPAVTDGGARVITVLMKWSKEGRRYSQWSEVQADMEKYIAAQQPDMAVAEVNKERVAAASMKKLIDDENRRKEALHSRMERERQERFAALRQRQEEERGIRQQRKADKDALRNLRNTATSKWRNQQSSNTSGSSGGGKKLASLRHGRAESTASTLSTVSMADSVKAGGGRRGGKGMEESKKQALSLLGELRKEREEQAEEEAEKQTSDGPTEAADEAYDDDDDEQYEEAEEEGKDGAADAPPAERPSGSPQSSGNSSDRSTYADKEAQEEKQSPVAVSMLTIDRTASIDDADSSSDQPAVTAVSSARPSSRVPPLLTPSPRVGQSRGEEVAVERVSAREKKSLRAESSSGESISARELPV